MSSVPGQQSGPVKDHDNKQYEFLLYLTEILQSPVY